MTDKPEHRIAKTLAAMVRGAPLGRIERLCESQKTVACSVLARMVEEAQDINTDYAMTIKHAHEASRAADKARIAELLGLLRDAKELAAFWINSGSKPGMTKTEYDVWLALGHQSKAMNAIRATLAKHGETK